MESNRKLSSSSKKSRSPHPNIKPNENLRSCSRSATTTRNSSTSPERQRSKKVKNGKRRRKSSRSRSRLSFSVERRRRHRSRSRSRSNSIRHESSSYIKHGYGPQYVPPSAFPLQDPPPSKCLGVFGLSTSTTEKTLDKLFSKFGRVDKIQIIYNKLSRRSRGFAFIYYDRQRDATEARDSCQGILIDDYRIRVDYSVTERAHPSTPGVYMGKRRDYGSPVRKYRRSRSYTPRRY